MIKLIERIKEKDTALSIMCHFGIKGIIDKLILSESDPNSKQIYDYTAVELLCQNENNTVSDLKKLLGIMELNNDIINSACEFAEIGNPNLLPILISTSLYDFKPDEDGNTLLIRLACNTSPIYKQVTMNILDYNCNIEYINNEGYTALMGACVYKNTEIAEKMIRLYGEKCMLENYDKITGYTVLMIAIRMKQVNIIDLLITGNYKINPDHVSKSYNIVLLMLTENYHDFKGLTEKFIEKYKYNCNPLFSFINNTSLIKACIYLN